MPTRPTKHGEDLPNDVRKVRARSRLVVEQMLVIPSLRSEKHQLEKKGPVQTYLVGNRAPESLRKETQGEVRQPGSSWRLWLTFGACTSVQTTDLRYHIHAVSFQYAFAAGARVTTRCTDQRTLKQTEGPRKWALSHWSAWPSSLA